jgi:hypothetical protein
VEIVLRCNCGTPWAKIVNGCLVVESRHRGEKHVNVLAMEELRRLMEQSRAGVEKEAAGAAEGNR